MATFYFNGAAGVPEGAYYPVWTDLGNWWMDAAHTIPATALPTSSDDVVVAADVSITTSGQTVANFTILGSANEELVTGPLVTGSLTVTNAAQFFNRSILYEITMTAGSALFTNRSGFYGPTLTLTSGIATFINSNVGDFSNINMVAVVNGDCVFIDSFDGGWGLWTSATVNGDCTFSGMAISFGAINGNATFNEYSSCRASSGNGTINGTATFNDYSYNSGAVNYDANYAPPGVWWAATFNDSSYNTGTVTNSSAFFNHLSNNRGSVDNCYFYDSSFNGTPDEPGTLQSGGEFYGSSYFDFGTVFVSSTPSVLFSDRTPYPIPRGINGSSILGVI